MNAHGRVAIGIDVGTSSVKATALTESGSVKRAVSAEYPITRPFAGAAEQDPDHWWAAVISAVESLLLELDGIGADVSADNASIGLTGQMHTSVLRDDDGAVTHPSILWSDKRAGAECDALAAAVPDFERITGNIPMPALTVTHLMWLRKNRPDIFAATRQVANPKDEIRRRLGAGVTTEPADGSATGLLDTRTGLWSTAIADAIAIDLSLMAPLLPSHSVTGTVTPGFDDNSQTLLRRLAGIPVVGGGGDQATQAVALGVSSPGSLGLSLGTSGVAFAALEEPRPGSFRHVYENQWLALNSTHAAGLSLAWMASVLETDVGSATRALASIESAPVFLPYLAGHRNGTSHRGAPGSFIGLEARHGREDLVYAVMEGVAFELFRLARSISANSEVQTTEGLVHLGGGGGRSATWRQIIADVFDQPVSYQDRDSSFGAAVVAAESMGWFGSFADSADAAPTIVEPRAERREGVSARMEAFTDFASRLAG